MLSMAYTVDCDAKDCRERDVRSWTLYWESPLPRPEVPDGWTKVGERIFCAKHKVQLRVDKKLVDY